MRIRALTRFNGRDAGSEWDEEKENAEVWIAEGYAEEVKTDDGGQTAETVNRGSGDPGKTEPEKGGNGDPGKKKKDGPDKDKAVKSGDTVTK